MCIRDRYYYDKHGKVPYIVGFLDKIEAEDSEKGRKDLETGIKTVNNAFKGLLSEYKRDPNFDFLNFMGHIPQIIDEEDDMVKY